MSIIIYVKGGNFSCQFNMKTNFIFEHKSFAFYLAIQWLSKGTVNLDSFTKLFCFSFLFYSKLSVDIA